MKRNSIVKTINIFSLQGTSVFNIGDTHFTNAVNRTIAIKREHELFYGNESTFEMHPVFFIPIPMPEPAFSPIKIRKYNKIPNICVDHIHIKGISNSAVVQIGNMKFGKMESRIFHSRQLLEPEKSSQ